MRMMNRDMTYHQWQQALGKPAEKVSKWFEDTIHSHLNTLASKTGGTVQREPRLSNGSKPDFLVEDGDGRACYVEAKGLFASGKKSAYHEWRVDLSDVQRPGSGGYASYRIVGEMTHDLPETIKESMRTWLLSLDPGEVLSEPWPYHTRTFPCGGAQCEISVKFNDHENSLPWCLSKSEPAWRHRIEEKVNEILRNSETGTDKYTQEVLGDTPLVLAILDLSSTHLVNLETELYGHPFITLNAEGEKTGDGNTGKGIWRDENGVRPDRTHIAGIWHWDGLPYIGEGRRKKPILATNPFRENRILSEALRAFKYIEWRPDRKGTLVADRVDGGHPYDEGNTNFAVHNYVDECHHALGVI